MDGRAIERKRAIDAAVADVRAIESRDGVTREALERMKRRLMALAAHQELFTPDVVPEDADHRFALYVNCSSGTYALNRFYDRAGEGAPREKGSAVVKQGTGVAFMHMYGLALEQLHRREYYKADEGAWSG